MPLPELLIYNTFDLPRAMIFVDGENLAIRYGNMLKARGTMPYPDIQYEQNVFVWRKSWGNLTQGRPAMMRKYYYTSVQGDEALIRDIEERLKDAGLEAPRVFKKQNQGQRTKGVDIALSTDMLLHAARKHYDIAILISGDADFIPLVEAVQGEGARVHVWSLSDGLNPKLKAAADEFRVLDDYLFE